jgi:hypothetical protein
MSKIVEIIAWICISFIFISIGYITINLILYKRVITPFVRIDRNEIVKNAVRQSELKERDYIICRYVRTTGFNFMLLQDEYGKKRHEYIRVVDSTPEGILSYDFLTIGNSFIFYVDEKNQYFDSFLHENVIEYTTAGWDVLYPIKRHHLFNTSPSYVLSGDLQ